MIHYLSLIRTNGLLRTSSQLSSIRHDSLPSSDQMKRPKLLTIKPLLITANDPSLNKQKQQRPYLSPPPATYIWLGLFLQNNNYLPALIRARQIFKSPPSISPNSSQLLPVFPLRLSYLSSPFLPFRFTPLTSISLLGREENTCHG